VLISRNIHIMGLGESAVESLLHDLMVSSENPTVAPYCKSGEVRLRVTARAESETAASALCDHTVATILENKDIRPHIYGVDCANVETALVRLFTERGLTVATAESCTGGMLGQRITGISGASAVYLGGFVTYTNDVKIRLLGVDPVTIDTHTEVSAETAMEMAEGARKRLGTDVGLSTTGYAGPGGGDLENPTGTVFIAVNVLGNITVLKYYRDGNRDEVREGAATAALRLLCDQIKEIVG
jgi:nicotinamide-nucleotide amidase